MSEDFKEWATGVADAIREKKGTTKKIKASDFASEIESIESGDNTLKKLLDAKKSASSLFYGFETDNISEIIQYSDTENVTKFTSMFQTSEITTIPPLNTSNGTIFYSMFQDCSKLRKIPLIDTSNGTNFSYMFYQCIKLTELPLIDTSNGTNFSYMFHRTDSLRTLPPIDTSKGTNFEKMFNQSGLTEIPPLNTSNATNFNSMFGNDDIEKIDISHYNISISSNTKDWCVHCFYLKALIIRSFGDNYALDSTAFKKCLRITGEKYIISSNTIYNPDELKDGYIYVPKNMVEILSNATNWSSHASQLRALEDYTVDGTTTGELDDRKVKKDYYVVPLEDKIYTEQGVKTLSITLNEFTNIPTVSIVSNNEEVATISNINATTNAITFDVNISGVEGTANISVSVNGDASNEFTFAVGYCIFVEPTYTVETIEGVTYGFNLNSNGYYESTNKGINNSYSLCKIVINNPNPTGLAKMTLSCINSGEANYDYGILSNIDTTLTKSYSADSTNIYKSFKGMSSTSVQEVVYGLPNGDHYIYVKFIKDSSGNDGNDSLQFKVSFGV